MSILESLVGNTSSGNPLGIPGFNAIDTSSIYRDLTESYWDSSNLLLNSIHNLRASLTEFSPLEPIIPPDNAGNNLPLANNIGNLVHNSATSYSDWVGNSDLDDFYAFSLTGQGNIRLSLTSSIANADLQLFDSNGAVIGVSAFDAMSEGINLSGLAAGNYFARVYSAPEDSSGSNTNYSLQFLTEYIRFDGAVRNRGPLPWDGIETRPVNIRIPDGAIDRVIDNTETWVVIHGHRSAPIGTIGDLASTIGQTRQVLVLDWSSPANNSLLRPDLSARWIHEVAEFAALTIRDSWGVAANNVNLIGHSLGSYVASEIGALFTGPEQQNPQINQLMALDPARSSTLLGYDINGLSRGVQEIPEFDDVSTFSRAFWGRGTPIPGGGGEGLGSERYAHTADESFRVEFDASDDAIANHNNIISLFTNMLADPTNPVSRLFQLNQGPHDYWNRSNGDEGVLLADGQNRPRALYFLTPTDSWIGAQNRATLAGGNLVTINDAVEKDWLQRTFDTDQNQWIGLTDSPLFGATEGEFLWASGQPVTYTNWAAGEPNNRLYTPEGEDFVEMKPSGLWNDLMLDGRLLQGIVEVA